MDPVTHFHIRGLKEEGNLEREQKTLNEEMEGPLLESIALALTVSAMLNHQPALKLREEYVINPL